MDEDATIPSPSPFKLMNFVSQEQLEESKKARGERVEDGTAQRDRPLYEILKENKDKKDAEFNERFKHRPPKALDEDETEFLDNLEMSKREYEQQMASEEAQQLRSFQEAVAAHSSIVYELKEAPSAPKVEDKKPVAKKNRQAPLGGVIISVKPQAKKAKIDSAISEKPLDSVKPPSADVKKSQDVINGSVGNLVSYSDESEDDDS
ncbi:protein FAM192A [Cinnamomum micranthum f. kanehirae]|uniref:Protein FAM192A n=1 Tax=Cinnamomum micranthum f. kanehirae TaxID=337451 RepID=A0A443PUJ9_9MAGN|nr:protein FAM192A [Cinnamomum micranthum f. kanehirae]